MTIELDHVIVSTHHKTESARQLAELLGVPWGKAELGPFTAVYVNPGLTLDFMDTPADQGLLTHKSRPRGRPGRAQSRREDIDVVFPTSVAS